MNPEEKQPKFVIYCRKSSEDDRQAASIKDQIRELSLFIQRNPITLAAEPFKEEKSAKDPGRPIFNDMLRRIERAEADAILCWDIDRLYRNPVDEGRVRWLLQRGIIREIRTPFRSFYPHDAGLLMGVEGGKATDHIITLRKGVFRGMRGKLDKGHRPGVAPPGYLNTPWKEQGERDILPDPERFELIRRAWDLMLTGQYSVRQIQRLAAEEWGLRSRKTKRLGGKPYSISGWYRIFTDPFYCGSFWWTEPEKNTRRLYKGAHKPIISQAEFDRVQLLLGRHGKPVPKTHRFAFTGLVRCGECDAIVTAEEKYQLICPACRLKFSVSNKDACPRCHLPLERMSNPVQLHYTYYHCTKRKKPECRQRSLRSDEFERQVHEILERFHISEEFKIWALQALHEDDEKESGAHQNVADSLRKRQHDITRELDHINAMILSPDTDWTLISREEIRKRKLSLLEEREQIETQLGSPTVQGAEVLELSERTFLFAAYARFWFQEGDLEQKRAILTALGSNLRLTNKTLLMELRKPLQIMSQMRDRVPAISHGFEPENAGSTKTKSPTFASEIPWWCRGKNAIRTYWETTLDAKPLPMFAKPNLCDQDNISENGNKARKLAA